MSGVGPAAQVGRLAAPARIGRNGLGEAAVFVVAVALRVVPVVTGGGYFGYFGYDPGVYYAASSALIHGKVPYRDYLLVHPPAVAVLLSPFALLGRLTSDHWGFAVASLAVTALAALNAVLIVRLARRLGLPRHAALIGGLFYAVWLGAVHSEYLIRLEPVGNFFVLCSLLAFTGTRPRHTTWLCLFGGAALGMAMSVKIWWVVPAGAIVLWQLVRTRSLRRGAEIAAGALAACGAVDGPFLLLAGRRMVRMVFSAQLGRSSVHPLLYRIGMITSADDLKVHTFGSDSRVGAILALGFAITMALAWLVRPVRPFVLLVVAQLAVLLLSPPFYAFYSDYLAVPAALVVAGAATACLVRGQARAGRSLAAWVPAAAALALTVGVLSTTPAQVTKFAHRAQMAGAARRARCVVSNTPMALIDLDALTRSFAPGCADRVDVTAAAFGVVNPSDRVLPHHPNRVWHADLYRYLTSGNAVIIVGARWISLGAADLARIDRHPVLASNGPDTLYATPGRH